MKRFAAVTAVGLLVVPSGLARAQADAKVLLRQALDAQGGEARLHVGPTPWGELDKAMAAAATANMPIGEIASTVQKGDPTRDSSQDFDFLLGKWKVHFRVLLTHFSEANKWIEYDGTEEFDKLRDTPIGFDEFDAYCAQLQMRNKGKSFRLYNTKTHQWSIYQVNNEGMLDQPVVGTFTDRRGEFYGQDSYNDRLIYVRNIWLNISPTAARWEQSWSDDGGKTWEVNWISDLSR
jgi:hypothetical protein